MIKSLAGKKSRRSKGAILDMSMPRESLKAMGLTEDQISSIITMHTETVDGLKSKLKAAKETSTKLKVMFGTYLKKIQ